MNQGHFFFIDSIGIPESPDVGIHKEHLHHQLNIWTQMHWPRFIYDTVFVNISQKANKESNQRMSDISRRLGLVFHLNYQERFLKYLINNSMVPNKKLGKTFDLEYGQ